MGRLGRSAAPDLLPSEECGALWSSHQDGRHPDRRRRCGSDSLQMAGINLGYAYQFLDDVADVVAGVAEVGKERGKDAGKCTAIDLFGVEGAMRKASEFKAKACRI
jgi:polyprenyl synthetase